jgi:hypothetical protein
MRRTSKADNLIKPEEPFFNIFFSERHVLALRTSTFVIGIKKQEKHGVKHNHPEQAAIKYDGI